MIPYSGQQVIESQQQRGIAEYSIPCDPTGYTGSVGVHFVKLFSGDYLVGSVPQAVAGGPSGAVYLSPIHGPGGSDSSNAKALDGGSGNQAARPAFANPEVTGYPTSGPGQNDPLTSGFKNTEKNQRTSADAVNKQNGTVWTATHGCSRLLFSLFARSNAGIADMFTLQVYRDLNNGDKTVISTQLLTNLENAQLIYQYGPVLSKPAPSAVAGTTNTHANLQIAEPVELPAGCNLYILIRNITNPGSVNQLVGSIRLVP